MIRKSKGTGKFTNSEFAKIGENVVIEDGVRIFHPENVFIGDNVYIGHDTILDGHYNGNITIGDETWIGPQCFMHGAGTIKIGRNVGVGPGVQMLTSTHELTKDGRPIIDHPLIFKQITIENGCDIGMGTIILPGITIGKQSVVGAGSVVTYDVQEQGMFVNGRR